MRSIYQTIQNFHALIETDQTVLRVIKTLDDNKLSKLGFGIGINHDIFRNIREALKDNGYVISTVTKTLKFFDSLDIEVNVSCIKLNKVTEYYILYSRHLKLLAIRSNTLPENKNFFPESFFSNITVNDLQTPLNGIVLLEGLSGRNFGGNINLFKAFGEALISSGFLTQTVTTILDHSTFNLFIESQPSNINNEINLYSFPLEEKFNTKITTNNGSFQSKLFREESKGLLFGENENLIGYYESKYYSHNSIILNLKFFKEENLNKFSISI